jgi:hypothetical protein
MLHTPPLRVVHPAFIRNHYHKDALSAVAAQTRREKRGENNDQVDCCCWLCVSSRNIGGSNDARTDS